MELARRGQVSSGDRRQPTTSSISSGGDRRHPSSPTVRDEASGEDPALVKARRGSGAARQSPRRCWPGGAVRPPRCSGRLLPSWWWVPRCRATQRDRGQRIFCVRRGLRPKIAPSMPRSAAEEANDAGTGSGSWPRTRRYAVGDEVEVLLTEKGFRGARYEATVTACLPGYGGYKVVYSELVDSKGSPLRATVAASDLRPRPPPPPPGRKIELFDLVEAYHDDGWWPGVVSNIQPKRRRNQGTRYAVSFPRFREVQELPASFVRPRREFVYGCWIDAQDVLRGIPQYLEGSRIEVMSDKQGKVWRPATIKKMVSSTNYVVSYGNKESNIEVLHSMFIRQEPIMKLEPSAEEYARKRNYSDFDYSSDSDYSPGFSKPGGNSDQYSSIPNKRVQKENAQTEEVHLRHSLNLRQYTDRSSLKGVIDMEIPFDEHVSRVSKLERECEGLGFKFAMGEEQIVEANAVEKLIRTPYDGKGRHSLAKAHCGDVVLISDDSSHGSYIEISDDSSYKPIKNLRRMNLPEQELHFNHLIHNNQASRSASRLWQAQSPQHYLLLDASRHSKEHACRNELSQYMEPLESSQDHSHKDGGQEIPLPGCQVQEFLGRNEAEEPRLLDHLHLENMLMKIDNSAAGGENHEMCQNITEVNSWVVGTSIEGADSGFTDPGISTQKTFNQSYGGAFPIGKLEPSSSRLQDFEGDLLCIEAPSSNTIDVDSTKKGISTEDTAAFLIRKLEPPSSELMGVKADLMCIEAPNDNKMEIKNGRMGVMADTSAFMPLVVPNTRNLSPAFSTTSLLLIPNNEMEVFEKIPQIPHFRKAWDCAPELREGTALGLMRSFATLAESIKKMRIQDEPTLFAEKMKILLDMEEENGFEVGPLKVRLHNLLCTRYHQIDLKNRKARLEKEILEIEAINCGLEQRLKLLDMCIMGMEENKYLEMKGSLDMQKTENCSSISKLQVDLCQVEESIKYGEANFCNIATAPWQSDARPLLL